MPPKGGTRMPLNASYTGASYTGASYTWGQQGIEAQFGPVFEPGQGVFSPGYPLVPTEPERVRLWDFPVGVNTLYTPRSHEPVSFDELRALADSHDITRLAIETRKDQLEKLDWAIRPRTMQFPAADARARSVRLADFWRRPDGERPFASWLRELLEDLLLGSALEAAMPGAVRGTRFAGAGEAAVKPATSHHGSTNHLSSTGGAESGHGPHRAHRAAP